MGSKLKLVLLALLLFGAPTLVVLSFFGMRSGALAASAVDGAQPGGVVAGAVLGPDERPVADHEVQLVLAPGSGARTTAAVTRTDAQGRFELIAPPLNGHYEIVAGGATWQPCRRPTSFLDRAGTARELKPVTLHLEPGCELELFFARADGGPPENGEYTLSGELRKGFLFGLVKPTVHKSGTIAGGELLVAGLPPIEAEIVVRMRSGAQIELELELEAGKNAKRIEY